MVVVGSLQLRVIMFGKLPSCGISYFALPLPADLFYSLVTLASRRCKQDGFSKCFISFFVDVALWWQKDGRTEPCRKVCVWQCNQGCGFVWRWGAGGIDVSFIALKTPKT